MNLGEATIAIELCRIRKDNIAIYGIMAGMIGIYQQNSNENNDNHLLNGLNQKEFQSTRRTTLHSTIMI